MGFRANSRANFRVNSRAGFRASSRSNSRAIPMQILKRRRWCGVMRCGYVVSALCICDIMAYLLTSQRDIIIYFLIS